ncbi:hypothetical protein [Paludibaculum fermentans]|uniref:Uncharacterized protein n=1 Tax=Paludibaculum fermentans TaxID=1473598 RepID=A0A7S7NXT5_PALFE|nr:hypothetical protein [Paludibaculum fermentans]QOY91154.1 hypothetical protein IRI77_14760 [Paludibaculum fermentans]
MRKPKRYRVYLAWDQSIDNPLEGIGLLVSPAEEIELPLAGRIITAVSHSRAFVLVDDPAGLLQGSPQGEPLLRVMRARLFGREIIYAAPLGNPPKGWKLSGRTGRYVWGGSDVVSDISPRPIPLRWWVPEPARHRRKQRTKRP